MTLQKLYANALQKWYNGYSQSRLVDYVYKHANNDTQATAILKKILS